MKRWLIVALVSLAFVSRGIAQSYWGRQGVESTMTRNTPARLGAWTYQRGFYLFAQYRMWKLTGDERYVQYIRDWLDLHVDDAGRIDQTINSLDNSEPALIDLLMYNETGLEKYRLAAQRVRDVYRTYPKTADGGFWHGTGLAGQLWLDGVYMGTPFLANYAKTFGDEALFDEAADQIIVYASHLQDTSGLMFHAYDEDGSSSWADPATHHSPHFWGRSMGWFGMAIVEILEVLPESHPKREALIRILTDLIEGLSEVQDPQTGLWYQVPDKGADPADWLESSCSCMYSFFTARAVQMGYVDTDYLDMAVRAYKGVIRDKVYFSPDGLINLKDICEGTGVSSDVAYYFARARNTNDLHGLAAFVMMCWQMAQMGDWVDLNEAPFVRIVSPSHGTPVWPGTDVEIEVQALDVDGWVERVEFYADGQCLAVLTESPWIWTWTQVPEGTHDLTAVAWDDTGRRGTSAAVTVPVTTEAMIVEAETGTLSSGSIDNNHAGFSGAGFVNFTNETGSFLDLPVQIPQGGPWRFSFRYANGTEDNRPCEILWDGKRIARSFDFPSTGQWTDWTDSPSLKIPAAAGDHVMRITGLTSAGGPNLDFVRWTLADAVAAGAGQ